MTILDDLEVGMVFDYKGSVRYRYVGKEKRDYEYVYRGEKRVKKKEAYCFVREEGGVEDQKVCMWEQYFVDLIERKVWRQVL